MSHIIIEGPDGAGKTSLARWLCHKKNMQYHHEGPPPAGIAVARHYAELLIHATHPTVFDRLHLGEIIYGNLLRGGSKISSADLHDINQLIVDYDVRVIGCLPPWETCWRNNQLKLELITDPLVMRAAYDGWHVLLHSDQCINLTRYDYTTQEFPAQLAPTVPKEMLT